MTTRVLAIAAPAALVLATGCVDNAPQPGGPGPSQMDPAPMEPAPRSEPAQPEDFPAGQPPGQRPEGNPDAGAATGGAPAASGFEVQGLPEYSEARAATPSGLPDDNFGDPQPLGDQDLPAAPDQDSLPGSLGSDFTLPDQPSGVGAAEESDDAG